MVREKSKTEMYWVRRLLEKIDVEATGIKFYYQQLCLMSGEYV